MQIERPKSRQPIPEHAKCVFKGVIFDVYQWEQELFDGSKTTFEKLKRADTVVVFPVMSDGKILLLEDEQPRRGTVLCAPGGRLESNEDVLEGAKRELLEETGYEANNFTLWRSYQPTTKIEHSVYVFVAKDLKKVSEPAPDAGERIKSRLVAFEDLFELIFDPMFSSTECRTELLEAQIKSEKMKELRKLFSPN